MPTKQAYVGAPPRPDGVYDLVVDGRPTAQATAAGGDTLTIDMATGTAEITAGASVVLEFGGPVRRREGHRGLAAVERADRAGRAADGRPRRTPARPFPPAVGAPRQLDQPRFQRRQPHSTWPARAASLGDVDLLNLGFGGSALLDPFVARVIRETGADLISLKIGINLVNTDLMRLRAFVPAVHGFLDTIREGHPDTPLLVISPIACPMHEDTPGPTDMDIAGLADGHLSLPGRRRPGRGRGAASSRSRSSARSWRASYRCGQATTPTSAISTASSSTARQMPPPAASRQPPPGRGDAAAASVSGSRGWRSRARVIFGRRTILNGRNPADRRSQRGGFAANVEVPDLCRPEPGLSARARRRIAAGPPSLIDTGGSQDTGPPAT